MARRNPKELPDDPRESRQAQDPIGAGEASRETAAARGKTAAPDQRHEASQDFDPYHVWLGIPKREQPPTHYRLLGVSKDEGNRLVIEEAVIRQTTYLRTYQLGTRAQICTQLLEEIAQAGRVLLDPVKRKAYDSQLESAVPKRPKSWAGERIQLPLWVWLVSLGVIALISCSCIVILVRIWRHDVRAPVGGLVETRTTHQHQPNDGGGVPAPDAGSFETTTTQRSAEEGPASEVLPAITQTPPPEDISSPSTASGPSPVPDLQTPPAALPALAVAPLPADQAEANQEHVRTRPEVTAATKTVPGVEWPIAVGGNGHSYEVVPVGKIVPWEDAKAAAEAKGGHLATIASRAENDFVFALIKGKRQFFSADKGPWLGGFQQPPDSLPNEGWQWVTGETFAYSNWANGEPNDFQDRVEDRVAFTETGTWLDVNRSGRLHGNGGHVAYVIEYPVVKPVQSSRL